MSLVICWPDNRFLRRRYWHCPTDECTTEQVVRFEAWYAPVVWCCRCGDAWGEDGRFPRPFRRGWRRQAQRQARQLWDVATYGDPPSYEDLFEVAP